MPPNALGADRLPPARPTGSEPAWSAAARSEAAGPERASSEAVGSEAARSEAVGSEAVGSEAAGSEAVGSEAAGSEAARSEAARSEAVGSEAVGSEAADLEAPEPESAGRAGRLPRAGTQAGASAAGDGAPVRPLLAAAFGVAVAVGVALSAAIASGGPVLESRWGILVRLAVWTAAWGVGVVCAFRLPARIVLPAVLVAALALRLAALAGPPTLSDDLYRYSWDGRVQVAGFNPYEHRPRAPELAALREPWLWPDAAGCAKIGRPEGCTRINRPSVRTIYPPVAQAWFSVVYRIAGIDAHHKAWQVSGLVAEMALVALLPLVLAAWGRDRRWASLYALSPFPVLEVVNNGHLEGLAALFVVVALLAAARRRPGWAGALIGAAALVKLYPAVLVAGLVGVAATAGRRWSPLIRGAAAATAVVVAGYLPHVISVGAKVLGYLPGYLREEDYDGGGRYLLAGILALPSGLTATLAAAGLLAAVAWTLVRRPEVPRACAALLGALLLATTPVQPWYAVPLVALAAVAARPAWTLVAVAAYPYFFAVILDAPHTIATGRISYGLALVAVVAGRYWHGPTLRSRSQDRSGTPVA